MVGIIQRTIFWELVKVFLLALVTLTSLFLLAGLVAEATQRGLAASQILGVIPLLIPNTLPYTIPATTLFATCIVYGRLSADNEITALKSAGVHLGRVMMPSVLLGMMTASATMALYFDFIPRTHHMLRTQVLSDVEELLYGLLKRQGSIKHPDIPFSMWVRQVQGKRLYDVIFKEREKGKTGYRAVARGREARIHYDSVANAIRVDMSYCSTYGENDVFTGTLTEPSYTYPLPQKFLGNDYVRRPSDFSIPELFERRKTIGNDVAEAYSFVTDPPKADTDAPPKIAEEIAKYRKFTWQLKRREMYGIEVELQMRPALAIGCLVFVLLGGPVGIWFSKSDYLSAFVTCFLPSVLTYYPLLLCGTNLSKDGKIPAYIGLWIANAVAGFVALSLYWRLLRR